jgi:predicted RNA-binding protein YlqC (UPF0109 family)
LNSVDLRNIVLHLTQAITDDPAATVTALPIAGTEQTLCLYSKTGTGRLLGRHGETFKALCRVISAASWSTGLNFRLVLTDPKTKGEKTKGERHGERN